MGVARAAQAFPVSVHEAEGRWYDTERWPAWVFGLETVLEVSGRWPEAGAEVRWESPPAGRGKVTERVVAYEPLAGQTVEVQDDTIEGRQSVEFSPVDGGVAIELRLEYRIKRRSPVTAIVDLLFVRRAMAAALRATLSRFGRELAADPVP